jgi:hypothetical protein
MRGEVEGDRELVPADLGAACARSLLLEVLQFLQCKKTGGDLFGVKQNSTV